jgi:hypothetical protein
VERPSPLARAASASDIRDQIDMLNHRSTIQKTKEQS